MITVRCWLCEEDTPHQYVESPNTEPIYECTKCRKAGFSFKSIAIDLDKDPDFIIADLLDNGWEPPTPPKRKETKVEGIQTTLEDFTP